MAIKTQGTQIYLINPDDESVVEVGCPTGADISGRTTDEIDTTCLSASERSFVSGLRNNGTVSMPINYDPANSSHTLLEDLQEAGTVVEWAIGYSDGTADPTADSGGTFDCPTTRSWRRFRGYVSEFSESFATNTIVTASLSIKISGAITRVAKA